MGILRLIVMLTLLTACDPNHPTSVPREEIANQAEVMDRLLDMDEARETDSFRISNTEIREEMLELFEQNNIEYTLSDDNLITIFVVDGDKVDDIYTDVRLTYIRRN